MSTGIRRYYALHDGGRWFYGGASFYRLRRRIETRMQAREGPAYTALHARFALLQTQTEGQGWRKKLLRYWDFYKREFRAHEGEPFHLREYPLRTPRERRQSELYGIQGSAQNRYTTGDLR